MRNPGLSYREISDFGREIQVRVIERCQNIFEKSKSELSRDVRIFLRNPSPSYQEISECPVDMRKFLTLSSSPQPSFLVHPVPAHPLQYKNPQGTVGQIVSSEEKSDYEDEVILLSVQTPYSVTTVNHYLCLPI